MIFVVGKHDQCSVKFGQRFSGLPSTLAVKATLNVFTCIHFERGKYGNRVLHLQQITYWQEDASFDSLLSHAGLLALEKGCYYYFHND